MARLATLLINKANRVRTARGNSILDQSIIGEVYVRRNKYDTGYVFYYGSTSIYIDDEPDELPDNDELEIIASKMLTVKDILNEIHSVISDDLNKAIKMLL